MTITVEAPIIDDETSLAAETTIEAFTDLLKAAAATPTPAPTPVLTEADVIADRLPGGPVMAAPSIWAMGGDAKVTYEVIFGGMPIGGCRCGSCSTLRAQSGISERIAALCEGAAEYIDRWGWHQGSMTSNTRVCLVGGIVEAARSSRARHASRLEADIDAARQAVSRWLLANESWVGPVEHWNDKPERRAHHVTHALRQTAKELRAGNI